MQQLDTDEGAVKSRTIELKEQGLTVPELLAVLSEEGYVNPRTLKPYGEFTLRKWTAGINSQQGHRPKPFEGFSDEQIAEHYKAAKEKARLNAKAWRKRNPNYHKEWVARWRK